MPTVIKRPTHVTTELQLRPGWITFVAAALVALSGATIAVWEGWRSLQYQQESVRLERENVELREGLATLKGRLEQVDNLLGVVGLHRLEAGKGGPR